MASPKSLQIPRDAISDENGILTVAWQQFFAYLRNLVDPLGDERFSDIVNNQASAANIDGLSFDYRVVSQGIIEFLVQRVTTGAGAVEIISSGVIHAVYKPTSATWALKIPWTAGPSASGLTFSITSDGQVQYTSTNETGTASISKITYRVRTLGAKNAKYSRMG